MRNTVTQFTSDADDKYRAVFLSNEVFAFFRGLVRIHIQQFLSMDEVDVMGKERSDLRIGFTYHVFRAAHSGIDAGYDAFQEFYVTLFGGDNPFPVPLVYI